MNDGSLTLLLRYSILVLITFIIQYNWIEALDWILFLAIGYNLIAFVPHSKRDDKFCHAFKLYDHKSSKQQILNRKSYILSLTFFFKTNLHSLCCLVSWHFSQWSLWMQTMCLSQSNDPFPKFFKWVMIIFLTSPLVHTSISFSYFIHPFLLLKKKWMKCKDFINFYRIMNEGRGLFLKRAKEINKKGELSLLRQTCFGK